MRQPSEMLFLASILVLLLNNSNNSINPASPHCLGLRWNKKGQEPKTKRREKYGCHLKLNFLSKKCKVQNPFHQALRMTLSGLKGSDCTMLLSEMVACFHQKKDDWPLWIAQAAFVGSKFKAQNSRTSARKERQCWSKEFPR